jgi:hypothetical protein
MRQVADEEDKLAQQENRPHLQVGTGLSTSRRKPKIRDDNKPKVSIVSLQQIAILLVIFIF